MSFNVAARFANQSDQYDLRRSIGKGVMMDPLPVTGHRLSVTHQAIEWAWSQVGGQRAFLDLAAGGGFAGEYAKKEVRAGTIPDFAYHAVEQSQAQVDQVHLRVPDASAAIFRLGEGGDLLGALEAADDLFLREYPVTLISQALEHVEDYYAFLDEAWMMTMPGGYLVLCVPRMHEHRTHFHQFDWDRLLAVVSELGDWSTPIACWERQSTFCDMLCAVRKPEPRGVEAE